jgi:hypothetical protein
MRTILLAALSIASTVGLANCQAGAGKPYGSRDPFVCRGQKEPARGAPSPSQLKDYVRCQMETGDGFKGMLLENVKAEVGTSRPYSSFTDSGASDIDVRQPVYPIRGSADYYKCAVLGVDAPGHNCLVLKALEFKGICYKTTFGEWSCPSDYPNYGVKYDEAQKEMPPPK